MKLFMKILSVFIALGGLLLLVVSPVMGIIFFLLGVAFFIYALKYKKPDDDVPVSDPSVPQPAPPIPHTTYTDGYYTIPVAGFDYRQPELRSLLTELNEDYNDSKEELLEYFGPDDRIYQYEIPEYPLHIQAEPDNPHDPNAVKVFAGDTFVGYVPSGRFQEIKECMTHNPKCSVKIVGGKYKYFEHDSDADFYDSYDDKYLRVKTDSSPVKAIMVFRW